MSDVLERLAAALDSSRLHAPPELPADISRNNLGQPLAWVTPETTAEVQRVVQISREEGASIAVCGRRTAYWRPLHLEKAVVVDTARLNGHFGDDLESGWIHVGAGTTIRSLDDSLRARGWMLPCHPDAFGETSIGSSVSADMSAGIGMGNARLRDVIQGLTVVLGSGEVVRTGAAHVLGCSPFTPCGLPDLGGLFLGAEGRYGIITEVVLSPWRRQAQASLTWSAELGAEPTLALAERLPSPGFYTTLRAEQIRLGSGTVSPWTYRLILRSPVGSDELSSRVTHAQGLIKELFGVAADVTSEGIEGAQRVDPWLGPIDSHDGIKLQGHFAGLDVVTPAGQALEVAATMGALAQEATAIDYDAIRQAIYAAPGRVNFGLHMNFKASPGERAAGVDAFLDRGRRRLGDHAVVPYRAGRDWRATDIDPGYVRAMQAVGRALDPDNLLNPGVGLIP